MMLRYSWQMGAAIHSVFGGGIINQPVTEKTIKRDDLIDRAIASQDEHAIKFTEACLREYALNSKPLYLQAADDAVRRF